jgi:predicted GIY-YIG superfamily endonuclease
MDMNSRWFVYVLRCGDGSLYTGITNDVARRVAAHNAGKGGKYTRSHLPVRVVKVEECDGRGEATRREAEIKRWSRQEKERFVNNN